MFQIIGIVLLFGLVFGSFLISGGNMAVILEALPHEMMCIAGAGIASFLISNKVSTLKATAGGFGKVFGGPKFKAQDYRDLLTLLFLLTKTMKSKGVIALESHIEKPHDSSIFNRFPKIVKDHFALDFICDTLRMMTMNLEDPHQIEDAMEKQLEKHHHEPLFKRLWITTTMRTWRRRLRCSASPTPCPRWASSPPCSASSRPWAPSPSRRRSWAA